MAIFSVTEALDRAGTAYRDGGWPALYRAAWAAVKPQAELSRTFAVQPSQPARWTVIRPGNTARYNG